MINKITGAIIVLGSPNTKDGRLYNLAKGRCKVALKKYNNHPGYKFILTGGYGAHFNESNQPHAKYLADYLIDTGIPESDILEFAESANSIEDAMYCKPIIQKYGIRNVIVITSDYHLDRAKYIFREIFKDQDIHIAFSAAKSDINDSEINIGELIAHEKIALQKLKASGIKNYYKNKPFLFFSCLICKLSTLLKLYKNLLRR